MTNLKAGNVIDGFVLERKLGAGSTGVVWQAQERATAKRLALKILHPQMSHDRGLVGQLAREAEVLAQLKHPHIAQALAFNAEGPLIYLAMEYLEGRPLNEELGERASRRQHFRTHELSLLLRQIASAVDHAHHRKIVHRDLKPQNVMIRWESDQPSAKVLDFGIARLMEGSVFEATTLGRHLGSLFYMSPEQTRGEPADAQSDVFSLASICFELLTLHRCWAWSSDDRPLPAFVAALAHDRANAIATVFERIGQGRRPVASALRPELGTSVDEVLERALSPTPATRPASATALVENLMAALPAEHDRFAFDFVATPKSSITSDQSTHAVANIPPTQEYRAASLTELHALPELEEPGPTVMAQKPINATTIIVTEPEPPRAQASAAPTRLLFQAPPATTSESNEDLEHLGPKRWLLVGLGFFVSALVTFVVLVAREPSTASPIVLEATPEAPGPLLTALKRDPKNEALNQRLREVLLAHAARLTDRQLRAELEQLAANGDLASLQMGVARLEAARSERP